MWGLSTNPDGPPFTQTSLKSQYNPSSFYVSLQDMQEGKIWKHICTRVNILPKSWAVEKFDVLKYREETYLTTKKKKT